MMAAEQNRKILWAICLLLVMLYSYGLPAQAQYGGGSGEPNDPYLIYTAEQMNAIGANTSDYHKHFKLMADIDLSGYTATNFNIIGRLYGSFRGVFDGNGHTISNFIYNNTERDYIGLFGCVEKQNVEENVEIKNLGLIDPNVDAGTANCVGSLVGRLRRGTITNCYVEGGIVSGGARVGGLVGDNQEGTINGSYASSTVTGDWPVGGLVGDNSNGNIITSYSTGTVRSTWQGPVGRWGASNRVGGLVGMGASGRVKSSFWDIETSGQMTSAGGTGKTTAEMHNPNTFMDAGWDFVGAPDGPSDIWAEPAGGGYPILWWQLSPPPELPTFSGGTGEPEDPYLVSTAADLNLIGHNPRLMRAHFKLPNDIDLAGIDFYIIGSESFPYTGVFDGNGHTISNFSYINTERDYAIGLFGCVEKENVEDNVEIKDLGLIDPNVDAGTANYVGPLVGWLRWGIITNCYVEGGSVSGEDNIGGMVGQNSGTITNCCVEGGSVLGEECIGGIVGHNSGRISECCSSGSVTGYSDVGGMVGFNWGTISDCCASGSVTGYGQAGGLVGAHSGLGRIIDSYATAGVSGEYEIGGLVGYIYWGTIANCCASGNVTGYECVGGMVGSIGDFPWDGMTLFSIWFGPTPRPEISNCYSTGDVTGNRIVGGLVGWLINGTIANCYSTGSVSGYGLIGGLLGVKASLIRRADFSGITGDTISDFYSTANITGNSGVGQVVIGGSIREVVNSFWDVETSGRATSAGGTGKTTIEMKTASTFLSAGWDFVDETANGTEDIWWILEGLDYPRLMSELRLQPLWGFSPEPRDGATDVTQSPILHWAPAEPTLQHDIYIGEDKEEVANATTLSLGIYRGRQPGELTTYEPGKLEWDATYYWRIDEVNEAEPNNLCKGSVWSFTTANFLIVDDFESYNMLEAADPNSNSIFNTWIAVLETPTIGLGFCGWPLPSFPVNSGVAQWSPTQVMRHKYHNSGRVPYSEATANTANLAIGQDWTQDGVGLLSLWFYGNTNNAPEPMYVAVANTRGPTAVVYHNNPDAATINTPMEWTIDLQLFADQGVDLTNVGTISIGFGDRNNPQPGGSGQVYFDDIRLYRPRREPEPAQ